MIETQTLKQLYYQQIAQNPSKTPLEEALIAYIENKTPDLAAANHWIDRLESSSTFGMVEKWRAILVYSLLFTMMGKPSDQLISLVNLVKKHSQNLVWVDLQPVNAFVALSCALAGLFQIPIPIKQLSSGAAPIDFSNWSDIPAAPFHAELGTLWAGIGKLTSNHEAGIGAVKLAEWQLNTLDTHLKPFFSLYAPDPHTSHSAILCFNATLFYMTGRLCENEELVFASEKQLEYLCQLANEKKIAIPPLAVMVYEWAETIIPPSHPKEYFLPALSVDPCTALACSRSSAINVAATLSGSQTGLGCLRYNQLEIVNYAPYVLPLNDLSRFGLKRGINHISQDWTQVVTTDQEEGSFCLEGRTCLAGQPKFKHTSALFRYKSFGGIWFECKQFFDGKSFNIEVHFTNKESLEQLAFVFFVKADSCAGNSNVIPLEGYKGLCQTINFNHEKDSFSLEPSQTSCQMQIFPLKMEQKYWGANFMIVYLLDPEFLDYHWQIKTI